MPAVRAAARAAVIGEAAVSTGTRELGSADSPLGRIRRPGGGCKRVIDRNPAGSGGTLVLVEPDVHGDLMSPLRLGWQLFLPWEWTNAPDCCRRIGVPQGTSHLAKWRLVLSLLDTLGRWQVKTPGNRRRHTT
ncbi:hypothetical protein GCM10010245_88690 [Streptomyces spectabilis]|nr:hypothetical protein GCM10010245_88690 [Streptomyces spectabilis]